MQLDYVIEIYEKWWEKNILPDIEMWKEICETINSKCHFSMWRQHK